MKASIEGRKIVTKISKKEAAALSAAIAVYLAKPCMARTVPTAELPGTLESVLEKMTELEGKIDELNSSLKELGQKVEEIQKR